jgi:thiol-disulfide isomerase/thioredoxin
VKRLTLYKFGAAWCGACKVMARAKTLEAFGKNHPNVKIEKLDLVDQSEDEETPTRQLTRDEQRAEDLAEQYDVQSLPTLLFVNDDDDVLARADHALNLKDLEALYVEALEAE